MNIEGKNTLFVRFGTHVVKCDFLVCEKLTTTYVLGGDFCDHFVNAIKPRKRVVELDEVTEIKIIRKRLRRREGSVQLPVNLKDV